MTRPQMLTQTPAEKYEACFVPAIFGPWARRLVDLDCVGKTYRIFGSTAVTFQELDGIMMPSAWR